MNYKCVNCGAILDITYVEEKKNEYTLGRKHLSENEEMMIHQVDEIKNQHYDSLNVETERSYYEVSCSECGQGLMDRETFDVNDKSGANIEHTDYPNDSYDYPIAEE